MKRRTLFFFIVAFVFIQCKKQAEETIPVDNSLPVDSVVLTDSMVFDFSPDSAPHFVNACYIDLNKITRISKFRSGIGHDYSDDFEFCRSMKHYFDPGIYSNDTIRIYAPVSGKIVRMFSEWAGVQVQIQSDEYPAFTFIIFHVNVLSGIQENVQLYSGQLIGYHIGNMTMSDIAVRVNTSGNGPKNDSLGYAGARYFSIFHLLNDSIFDLFNQRGVSSLNDMIITQSERDNQPLDCNGEYFQNEGAISNWFVLQ